MRSLYPPPPHHFRGAKRAFATYEADTEKVSTLLPPGVEPDSDPVVCQAWVCWYPWSVFGEFLEAYIFVRVTAEGTRYWYQPLIFTNSEPPLTAGRRDLGVSQETRLDELDDGGRSNCSSRWSGPPEADHDLRAVD